MTVPPCVFVCVYTARLGKGYRITAVFCLWEVPLRSFPFVVPTDLSFCSGAFWEATPGTFCISLLWQIVTNCQPYINRLRRIWEMPGAQSIEANWQENTFSKSSQDLTFWAGQSDKLIHSNSLTCFYQRLMRGNHNSNHVGHAYVLRLTVFYKFNMRT